jgi:hypothetical protein
MVRAPGCRLTIPASRLALGLAWGLCCIGLAISCAGLAPSARAAALQGDPGYQLASALSGLTPLSDTEDQAIRGGYYPGHGIVVDFGYSITSSINHVPVQTLNVSGTRFAIGANGTPRVILPASGPGQGGFASIGTGDGDSPQPVALTAVANTVSQVFTTPNGLTTIQTLAGLTGAVTQIQNQAPNQLVQTAREVNIAISGLAAAIARGASAASFANALHYAQVPQ